MGRRRYDHDFDGFEGPHFNGPRGYRGPAGLFGLVFSLVSLGLTIAFNVLGVVLHVFSGLAGGRRPNEPIPPNHAGSQQSKQEPKRPSAEAGTSKTETGRQNSTEKESTINRDQVKKTFNQDSNEHTSDWNILLFVLTLIPIIITLAMKRLDLAGYTLLGGTTVIVLYNMARSSIIKSKERKKQKQKAKVEEQVPETEVERIIKDAFNKIYGIRKELFRIQKPEIKQRLEGLCTMAEKIIGEVRANPDALNSVRKFFYYYLDAFNEVFEKYLKLSSFSESSEEVQKVLAETEKSFTDMEDIFKELCEGMLEKDMLNLKATINVLKNSNYTN